MSIGKNLRRLRKLKGLTLEQVALPAGTDSGNLSRIERGIQGTNYELLRAVAGVLGAELREITGEDVTDRGTLTDEATGSVVVKDALPGRVPLIPWNRAARWKDPDSVGLFEWLAVSRSVQFGRGFATVLPEGDSMVSETPPSFPAATILVLEDRPAQFGDYVLASQNGVLTFKKYVEDTGVAYLAPLNKRYPLVRFEGEILGVLIESITRTTF